MVVGLGGGFHYVLTTWNKPPCQPARLGLPWKAAEDNEEEAMKATVLHAPGDIRIEEVPDAGIVEPTDAVVRVVRGSICGSDLWPYSGAEESVPASSDGP